MIENNLMKEIELMGLTQEQFEEIVKLLVDKKNNVIDIDYSEIVDRYNLSISKDTLRKASSTIFGGSFIYQYLQQKTIDNKISKTAQDSSEFNMNKDGSYTSKKLIEMSEAQNKDPDYILKAHGFTPTELWKIVSLRNNFRQAISQKDGVVGLYASFLTVKPVDNKEISFNKWSEWFDKLDRNYTLPTVQISDEYKQGNKMILINLADLHLNLLASMFTTGNEYNCKIAEQLFFKVLGNIISRTAHYNFKKVIFCLGGDILNADNMIGTTTKGTPQTNELHYFDAVEILTQLVIKAIDVLKNQYKCSVDVIYVAGNHDELTGFQLAKYVDAWYRNDNKVTVDYSPLPRKYIVFGKTLLAFAHNGNIKKLPSLIADEARKYWSSINMTEVFLQHLHTESVLLEENNMRIQRLPTISAKSKWTNDSGYNSKRQFKTFIFDEENGLSDVLYTYVD